MTLDERRLDIGEGIISMLVTNNGPAPVDITAAELSTPLYPDTSRWTPGPSGRSSLKAGATVALPAPLTAAPICGNSPQLQTTPPAEATVLLTVDGQQQNYEAPDPYAALERLQQQSCLEHAVLDVAALELSPDLAVAPDGGTAVVRLSIVPAGNTGSITLVSFGETILLAEDPGQQWPRNISVSGSDDPAVVELSVLPARCDAHALAEDKTGTKLPIDVETSAGSGQIRLVPDPEFTGSVYSFVQSACSRTGGASRSATAN